MRVCLLENHNNSANRNFICFTKRHIEHPRSGMWTSLGSGFVVLSMCFYVGPFYVWIMPFCEFFQSMSGVDKIIQCTPGFTDTVSSEHLSEDKRSWTQRFLICSSKEILSNHCKRIYRDSTEVNFSSQLHFVRCWLHRKCLELMSFFIALKYIRRKNKIIKVAQNKI